MPYSFVKMTLFWHAPAPDPRDDGEGLGQEEEKKRGKKVGDNIELDVVVGKSNPLC